MRLRRRPAREWHGQGLVLLVEDEAPVRRYAARLLAELGFTVVGAADGAEAVAVFHERGAELALVLLDVSLPGPSGEELLDEIKGVPVVLCSGYDARTARRRFGDHPVAGFLAKPYGLDQMRTALREVVGQ
jgi:two-component system cell cycle sensor histidine kinase/response regulator CckA